MDALALLIAATLSAGTVLAIAGLGLLINERAGIVNLGAEGMMLVSAVAGFAIAVHTGSDTLAFGAGGEFRSPMALAVIGGLIFSTILSLVFVPAMFMVMDDLGALCWRFGQKLLVSSGEEEESAHAHAEPAAKGPPPVPPAMSPAAK